MTSTETLADRLFATTGLIAGEDIASFSLVDITDAKEVIAIKELRFIPVFTTACDLKKGDPCYRMGEWIFPYGKSEVACNGKVNVQQDMKITQDQP